MQNFIGKQKKKTLLQKFIAFSGNLVYSFGFHNVTENIVFNLVNGQERSEDAFQKLKSLNPDVILVTNPFWLYETAIAVEAKKLNIKIVSLVPSWDNITTKSRMTFQSDAFIVWSNLRTLELNQYYPYSKSLPIFEMGTPQYEVLFKQDYYSPRSTFADALGLNPNKKIVVYATGSPHFLKTEYDGAALFAELFKKAPEFKDAQLLIRPHPNKDNNELLHLNDPDNGVFVQFTPQHGLATNQRDMDEADIKVWVNTFRHTDVVINLSSTVTLDAMAVGKPVININFDPHPAKEYEDFIKEINSTWTHLQPIWNCKAIPQVNDFEEMLERARFYLDHPNDGKEERDAVFELICGRPWEPIGGQFVEFLKSVVEQGKRK